MRYTFYKGQEKYETDNVAAFCREHELQRRHIYQVIERRRARYKGFSLTPEQPEQVEDPGILVSDVLDMAEIAAEGYDAEHQAVVMDRVERMRNGEPLKVKRGNIPDEAYEELLAAGLIV